MDKRDIIAYFPNLKNDPVFKISSPEDPDYNCIAWAYQLYKDRWMATPKGVPAPNLDGVTWWPDGVEDGDDIHCLEDAFKLIGYERCFTWKHEDGFQKVALYYNPDTSRWTHAARESRNGCFWMSKLGRSHDIYHENPQSIEGTSYGLVYCIMKRLAK